MAGKYPTPKGPAATAAKRRYNKEHYEDVHFSVNKGEKAKIDETAKRYGLSRTAFIQVCIEKQTPVQAGPPFNQSEWGTCPECGNGLFRSPPCWCAYCGKKVIE